MQVDAGQLRVVVQHALKVGCTVQYARGSVDSPFDDQHGFQRTECRLNGGAGKMRLSRQFAEELFHGGDQVACPATFL